MSSQVDRLQALLGRVQQNRLKPHAEHGASMRPVASASSNTTGRSDARAEPRAASRAEASFGQREAPTSTVGRPAADTSFAGKFSVPPGAIGSAAAPNIARQAAEQPLLIDPPIPQPTKPVAQVVSKHPPSVASTFGELLRRSLSLRPR
jgi:hypothetical protein